MIFLSFLIGFTVDIFSDTSGVNALSCTLIAILRDPIFYLYVAKDDKSKTIKPSISSLGWPDYCKYLFTISMVYCFLMFSIEYFNLADIKNILILTISSGIFTFIVSLALSCIVDRKRVYE